MWERKWKRLLERTKNYLESSLDKGWQEHLDRELKTLLALKKEQPYELTYGMCRHLVIPYSIDKDDRLLLTHLASESIPARGPWPVTFLHDFAYTFSSIKPVERKDLPAYLAWPYISGAFTKELQNEDQGTDSQKLPGENPQAEQADQYPESHSTENPHPGTVKDV